MKVYFLITLISSLLVSFAAAEDPPEQILKPGDVKHFIKSFPSLEQKLEDFDMDYNPKEGTLTIPEAVKARGDFLAILKQHGWDENFYQKAGVILLGYSYIVYGEEMQKADSEFEKSFKEIDSNPHLSDEMKKQMKEQMEMVKNAMSIQKETFKISIHPKDLELISPNVNRIQEVIDKDYEKGSSRSSTSKKRRSHSTTGQGSNDLAAQINELLKKELEKEFGPLSTETPYIKKEIYGRVISIDFELRQGGLDKNWNDGVVRAIDRLGISAEIDGSEVRAENQEIANSEFMSLQFTTARDPDSIAATFLFPN